MVKALLTLGLLGGGIAAWMYRDDLRHYVDENTRDLRSRAQKRWSEVKPQLESVLRTRPEDAATSSLYSA